MTTKDDNMYMGGESDWKSMWPKSYNSGLPKDRLWDAFKGLPAVPEDPDKGRVHQAFMDRLKGVPEPSKATDRQVGGDHYKRAPQNMQPWDIIDAWGLDFYAGNVLKYILRAKHKGGVEDLQKARHYLDKMIDDENAS